MKDFIEIFLTNKLYLHCLKVMKGKTSCPKCNHEIITDMPDNSEKHDINCPECKHTFSIRRNSNLKSNKLL